MHMKEQGQGTPCGDGILKQAHKLLSRKIDRVRKIQKMLEQIEQQKIALEEEKTRLELSIAAAMREFGNAKNTLNPTSNMQPKG